MPNDTRSGLKISHWLEESIRIGLFRVIFWERNVLFSILINSYLQFTQTCDMKMTKMTWTLNEKSIPQMLRVRPLLWLDQITVKHLQSVQHYILESVTLAQDRSTQKGGAQWYVHVLYHTCIVWLVDDQFNNGAQTGRIMLSLTASHSLMLTHQNPQQRQVFSGQTLHFLAACTSRRSLSLRHWAVFIWADVRLRVASSEQLILTRTGRRSAGSGKQWSGKRTTAS